MTGLKVDIIIVGGGLSGSLFAWRLKTTHPHLKFLLFERGDSLGGNHTWSFHSRDLSESAREWLSPLVYRGWNEYDVFFPKLHKKVPSQYASIRSEHFHQVLITSLRDEVRLNADAMVMDSTSVTLKSGEKIEARWVFDSRGLGPVHHPRCGFQKFLGWDLKLRKPHGLEAPILMDACVEQKEGYRFVYCLPWTETEVLVEDTRYSLQPHLNAEEMRQEIKSYCAEKGWEIEEVLREEKEALPLPFQANFLNETPSDTSGVLPLGMRASLLHPTTGYSLPHAITSIEYLTSLSESQWLLKWPQKVKQAKKKQKFFMRLNRVMFFSRKASERYLFLQHFYHLPPSLMSRFYAGQMSLADKLKFFMRRPPVSLGRAFQSVIMRRADGTHA